MTVLFADVVHSMDIAAAVGAERLREIMADLVEHHNSGREALRRHGGQVHRRRDHGGVRGTGGVGGPRGTGLPCGAGHPRRLRTVVGSESEIATTSSCNFGSA